MPTPEVEEFARILLTNVRDEAISSCDRLLHPTPTNVKARRWHDKMIASSSEEFAKEIIPDCVDEAIFYLLDAIDNGLLGISFTATNGNTVDLTEAGRSEMAGWFAGTDGWKAASRRRGAMTIWRIFKTTRDHLMTTSSRTGADIQWQNSPEATTQELDLVPPEDRQ